MVRYERTQKGKWELPRRVGNEFDAILDVGLEITDSLLEELLLIVVGIVEDVEGLLCAVGLENVRMGKVYEVGVMLTYPKLNRNREVVTASLLRNLITTWNAWEIDEGWFDDGLALTLLGFEQSFSEAESCERHGECGRTSTVLCLDDLITTELDTVDESIELVFRDVDCGLGLTEQRNNSGARVTSDNRDVQLGRILLSGDLSNEGLSTDDVEGSDTKELLGIEDTGVLEDFGSDGDGRVDGVGDDKNVGLGTVLGDGNHEVSDDASVGLEEIIAGHARLALRARSGCVSAED